MLAKGPHQNAAGDAPTRHRDRGCGDVSPMLTYGEMLNGGEGRGSLPEPNATRYDKPDKAAVALMEALPLAGDGALHYLFDTFAMPERRFMDLYGRPVGNALRDGPMHVGNVTAYFRVLSTKGGVARLAIDRASFTVNSKSEDAGTVTFHGTCVEFSGVSAQGTNGCLTDDALLARLGAKDLALVAVKENGSWRMSIAATLADAYAVVVRNL